MTVKTRCDGCLGKREIDREELLIVERHPAVLVTVESLKGFRKLLDKDTCADETVESNGLSAWRLITGRRRSYREK